MAQLPSAFKAKDHGTMQSFAALPAGDYMAKIVKTEMKMAKKKPGQKVNGQYLSVQLKIMNGKYKDRTVFRNLNLINDSQQAVEIASQELATICAACEKENVEDTEVLHDVPMVITLVKKPATANQPESNNIKFYRKPTQSDVEKFASGVSAASDNSKTEEAPKKKSIWD